jgi:glycosidase
MKRLALALVAAACVQGTAVAATAADCQPRPFDGRDLYLRGSFNTWNAVEAQRFTWACNRFELVTRIEGEQRFKIADEGWSADADYGDGPDDQMRLRGPELSRRFKGSTRIVLDMSASPTNPTLRIEACPTPAPFGDTALFMRGSMNNFAALETFAFQYHCDAYYLNVKLSGRHEFKVADAAWQPATTFGDGSASFSRMFSGEQTVRLAFDDGRDGRPQLSLGPRSFADPSLQALTDPVAASLRFDSRAASHKQPFGAVVPGTAIGFQVDALPGVQRLTLVVESRRLEGNQETLEYTELARVAMSRSAGPDAERWAAQHRFDRMGVYGYWFEAEIGGRRFALQNNRDPVFWTREKGSGGAGSVAALGASTRTVRRFRQTVYAADFRVPDWAADAVYYYVFPERFRNGDPTNDPRPGRDRYHDHTVEQHQRWNERPFRPGSGDGSDPYFNNDFFGGDLAGLVDKLDHIRDLGANTLYLTPIFRAASNHKYDTADFHQVDPAFGSNADFERLTREAAARGLRVIVDTSLNHTGADSIYFDRYGNFRAGGAFEGGQIRADSPYASWYRFDPAQRNPDDQFQGWVGVKDLPELDKANQGFRDFAYRAPDSVMKRWLDAGAAGWRMDVAPWVPDEFWREWRAEIKRHRPDAVTIAETWFDAAKHLLGDMFDSTMNYIFRNAVLAYAAGGDAREFVPQLELMREHYPPPAFHALMNLLSTHDQPRSLYELGWRDDADGTAEALAKRRFALAVLFQMSYPGSPAVYYGDEVGVTGGADPDNRRTFPWADLGGRPDEAMLGLFKRLIRMRQDHPVLRRGQLQAPLYVDAHAVVLLRRLGDRWALTATNNADQVRSVTVNLPPGAPDVFTDALTGAARRADGGQLTLELPALFGTVLAGTASGG